MRPSSGASTRSRRDEVWETKRQRWLHRQGGGGGGGGGGYRPSQLSDLGGHSSAMPGAPKSPLSKLMQEGYPRGAPTAVTAHQPYGDRPSSGSGCGFMPGMQNQASRGSPGGGFDAGIANQWNANVASGVRDGQNRHDPSVSGPHIRGGGTRVTQAPGGGSSIDLGWPQGGGGSAHPPRMPSGGCTPQGPGSYGGGQAAAPPYSGAQDSYQRHPQRGNSPSAQSRGSGSGLSTSPWGREDDYAIPQRARQAATPPFGIDTSAQMAGGRAPSNGRERGQPSSPFGGGGCGGGGGAIMVAAAVMRLQLAAAVSSMAERQEAGHRSSSAENCFLPVHGHCQVEAWPVNSLQVIAIK
eukprot:CAMPEP_0115163908 /NCGR_PEP_ID=MMETSP0227-20121206/72755_1 /TAXON_ID=89957 /ORGANISM="Polarella glacialis, Strain CCMP 1383" /LENGTH=352 /DNA_ID=CAMNT_0002576235 /DNA_START=93 /DNA_END=1149 /DNA_ORIENTATION=+